MLNETKDPFRESWKRAEKWIHNEKVRKCRYGYRFSPVWEYEKHARINLKLTKFLYHGTQERRLTKILENKTLKPNCETGEINYEYLSDKKSVYVTTDKKQARQWAFLNIIRGPLGFKEKPFIIAIPKKLLAHRLKLDENLIDNLLNSFRVEGPIRLTPECMIEEVKGEIYQLLC